MAYDPPAKAVAIAQAAKAAGFTGDDLVTALAIAKAESAWNPAAKNTRNPNGTTDWGAWQINDVNRPTDYEKTTVNGNARAAFRIYKSTGFKAWVTYKNGAFQQFVPEAKDVLSWMDTNGVRMVGTKVDEYLKSSVGVANNAAELDRSSASWSPTLPSVPDVPGALARLGSWLSVGITALIGIAIIALAALLLGRQHAAKATARVVKAVV